MGGGGGGVLDTVIQRERETDRDRGTDTFLFLNGRANDVIILPRIWISAPKVMTLVLTSGQRDRQSEDTSLTGT